MASLESLAPIFLRLRYVLLPLLIASAAAAANFHSFPVPLALAVLAGGAVAWIALRHPLSALLVALAPLPGLLWFAPGAYPLAFAAALLMASGMLDRLLRGDSEERAFAALFEPVLGLAAALALIFAWSLWQRVDVAAAAAAGLAVLLALPAGVIFMPYGERFHFSANRARETRARLLEYVVRLAEARWALSFCGVALVLAVLAWFEIPGRPAAADWMAPLLVGGLLGLGTLDGRAAIAALITAALLLLFGHGMNDSLPLFVLFALTLAGAAKSHQGAGEAEIQAWARALEDRTSAIFFAGAGAALTGYVLNNSGLPALAALIAAGVLFPALTLALHHLLPRRKSLEQLYKA